MAKTTEELIADIDAKLETLLAAPDVDYTEGDVTVKGSQVIPQLLRARAALGAAPSPNFELITFDDDVNAMGL